MKWQEYEEAVARLYEQAEGIGSIRRNAKIPDKITGEKRQVDVLVSVETKGHHLDILIDAKFHAKPIDVKVVENIAALADAVGACKSVVVCPNGWTKPAKIKADHLLCDLRLVTVEDALNLVVADKWKMCTSCMTDCIVMDQDGFAFLDNGKIRWWIAGACRECHYLIAWCQDCGIKHYLKDGESVICDCSIYWSNETGQLMIGVVDEYDGS